MAEETRGSSAGVKEAAAWGTREAPLGIWTSEGYYRRTRGPGPAKFETLIEGTKGINVSKVEGVHRAVHCIQLARQDVVFLKGVRTWALFGVVIAGFTLGAAWVAPLSRKELVKDKIQQ